MIRIGTVGGRASAMVDDRGALYGEQLGWHLDWWIGADDRWRVPARETGVRQSRVGDGPIVRTSVRIPSGDAIQTVYAVRAHSELAVWEIENDSPAAFVIAAVVNGARAVSGVDTTVLVDRRVGLMTSRPASRWAVGSASEVDIEVCGGSARTGNFPSTTDRSGRITAAFLFPVAHRTRFRMAISLTGSERVIPDLDLAALPDPDTVARGWAGHLAHGMRVELPDRALMAALRAAQANGLLESARRRPTPETVAALEDWGFDTAAAIAWDHLSTRARRQSRRAAAPPTDWSALATDSATLLRQVRQLLVADRLEGDNRIDVLSAWPAEWRGQGVEVHDAPTRFGPVSFAVRWHGARPALFWDIPAGVELRAPGLDSNFVTTETKGEALLEV